MNRKYRRMTKSEKSPKTYTLTDEQIQSMKRDVCEKTVCNMLLVPAYVLYRDFGKLMKKEVGGINRIGRFVSLIYAEFDRINRGELTFEEIAGTLEKVGVTIEKQS